MPDPTNGHNSDRTTSNRDRARTEPYAPDYEEPARKPGAERPNAFNTLAWLVEGATGLLEELRHSDLGLSQAFWTHAYAARRESLLALRAVLDDLIAQSESQGRQEQERQERRDRRGGVEIEF